MQPKDLLFVDDQWCRPEERGIYVDEYGELLEGDTPYQFHYETAEHAGHYSHVPVLEHIASLKQPGAVFLDIMFGDKDNRLGLKILEEIRARYPVLPVFMMTALEEQRPPRHAHGRLARPRGDFEAIRRAMELGANEYLVKKWTLNELRLALRMYVDPTPPEADHAIWGNSAAIRAVRETIAVVAYGGTASVLVVGESGTGKELVARAIHRQGPRRGGPFVDKNCAHAHEGNELLDDELFGHEKGAYTGADRRHVGRLERADKGLLFLDEIADMPPQLQAKLLRVLETKSFQRLGGGEDVRSDFQLVCATNVDPQRLVAEKRLREDLYYRLNQVQIRLPPLRERRDDIGVLARLFLNRFKQGPGGSYRANRIADDALNALSNYGWPGNVRELRNLIERTAMLARADVIDARCLPTEVTGRSGDTVGLATALPTLAGDEGAPELPDDPTQWPRQRLLSELRFAVAVKHHVARYKGKNWKAEFMRLLYPHCKAQSAKGVDDLIRRFSKSPWGDPRILRDDELARLLDELRD